MTFVAWDVAWHHALYGRNGFYRRPGGPAAHFRTSVHASDQLAGALLELARRAGLRRVVDVGSGRGELLKSLRRTADAQGLTVELVGCDVVDQPPDLLPDVAWVRSDGGTGVPEALWPWLDGALVVAHEWLDDVPCPVAQRSRDLTWRAVEVEPSSGRERLGSELEPREHGWLERWWPVADPRPGDRAEVGLARDDAWTSLVEHAESSLLLAVDYGHVRRSRPPLGTLTGYRDGRGCAPVPDGSCDVTAHVAIDAVGAAGESAGACASHLTTQREALRALGVDGSLPPAGTASADPMGYLRALSTASHAGELLDPSGLGGFWWLVQSTSPQLADLPHLLDPG
ncbi:MAG TPA: SAM-dependent methyltransferase [Angustibacter sp.]|nr:SAM-dependent methyltransferase [Angustibacter sp.]